MTRLKEVYPVERVRDMVAGTDARENTDIDKWDRLCDRAGAARV